ncbi:response regulator transcription factor [Pedobacter panaciterrae]|uniref:response regulator transcription factor n=1 Tax=Pedobacter panaciterrae TaxID=363849 RepID=UPI00155DD5E2|nr:response regulator transcription factor [Pedobacter panaciterrae]NQX55709.1 response regulator transcription factor [Pedobacter panaciterrae]
MNRKISLAIVDDHPIVVQGLQMILTNNSDINVTGCFTSGSDFIEFLKNNEVDIVLLDIMLPDSNGMDVCKEIKSVSPNTCVLALSNHSERSIVMQMLQNGASGYLLKNVSVQELTNCIYEALNGEVAFSKAVKEILARPSANDLKGIPQLTKREKEVLQLIAEGKTTALMAKHLFVSPLTIETHRRNLLQKFEVKNVASLIKIAADHGLLKSIG